jgi:hypothetical protein
MKPSTFFAATTLIAGIVAVVLWQQLKAERAAPAQRVEEPFAQNGYKDPRAQNGNPVRAAANIGVQQPALDSVAGPPAPVAQAVTGDANPQVPAIQRGCEARISGVKQSAAATTAQWGVELQLAPDEIRRITEARQAHAIASEPCASLGGSTAELEQLQAQFYAALGPARLEQLLELNANRLTQSNIAGLGKQLRERGIPLDEEQARQLTTIFHEEHLRSQREAVRTGFPSEPRAHIADRQESLKLAEEKVDRIRVAAQSYLRPEQMAVLDDNAKRELDVKRSNVNVIREAVEQGRAIQPPPLLSIVPPPR